MLRRQFQNSINATADANEKLSYPTAMDEQVYYFLYPAIQVIISDVLTEMH
jgi:hypothetical protein